MCLFRFNQGKTRCGARPWTADDACGRKPRQTSVNTAQAGQLALTDVPQMDAECDVCRKEGIHLEEGRTKEG